MGKNDGRSTGEHAFAPKDKEPAQRFGAAPTVVADGDRIRGLVEQMQADRVDDRATRKMDAEQFKALLRADRAPTAAPSVDPPAPPPPANLDAQLDSAFPADVDGDGIVDVTREHVSGHGSIEATPPVAATPSVEPVPAPRAMPAAPSSSLMPWLVVLAMAVIVASLVELLAKR
jgi:hypothetical protein